MNARLPGALLALLVGAAASAASAAEHTTTLDELGLTSTVKRYHVEPDLDLRFSGRSNEVLTGARLELELDPGVGAVHALEVLVNQEAVASLQPAERERVAIEIDPKLLGDSNVLSLRLVPEREDACGEVSPGTWGLVRRGQLATEGSPLPLPNDLSILPLPFFDRDFDREARIPVVFARSPTTDELRLAGLFAGWIGVDSGLPTDFPVHIGVLPSSHAVVLVSSSAGADALGLPAPEGPSLRMIDHPDHPDAHHKLLIIGGRNLAELELALRRVAAGVDGLRGEMAFLDEVPSSPPRLPYDAPRWLDGEGPLELGEITAGEPLVLSGTGGGSLPLRFRLAPDLFSWPTEWIDLDVVWEGLVPQGRESPRVDVEFNGQFVATLPPLDPLAVESMEQRVRLHRELLRGYNELAFHVTWQGGEACEENASAEVRVLPSSTLRLERMRHFALLPDVASFVHDGFPFTRMADLSDTAVVLPASPQAEEIGTLLSLLAHFSAITGDPGGGLTLLSPAQVGEFLDKDLLLVGLGSDHPLLRRWADRFPLRFGSRGVALQMPVQTDPILAALAGWPGRRELERARPVVARARRPAAVMAMESPLAAGRVVVAVTAGEATDLPDLAQMRGYARSRTSEGDLLLLSGEERWAFRIGPTWQRGALDRWTGVRFFLAQHWLALVPFFFVGAMALAWPLRGALQRRAEERLAGSAGRDA